jgi:PAS domain S-box-containing protein
MKYRYLFGIFFIWIFICCYFFQIIFSDAKQKAIDELNARQLILAIQAQHGIEKFFSNTIEFLKNVSESGHIIHLDDRGKQELDLAYKINPGGAIRAITRMDKDGLISYTTPYNPALIGTDISSQQHVKDIIKRKRPTISDVFTAVQGYRAIALHVPVIKDNKFYGTLAVLIDFLSISKENLEKISFGKTGYAWMTSKEGIELFCPVPGHTDKSIFENCKEFPGIISMANEMVKGKQGKAAYIFDMIKDEHFETIKKHAVYHPIKIIDSFWTIVVASNEDEVLASLVTFKNKLIFLFTFLLLGSFYFSYYGVKSWGIVREETNRKQAEAALNEKTRFLDQIIETSALSMWISDKTGTAIRTNPACLKFFGATKEEVVGKYNLFKDVVIEKKGFMPVVKKVFDTGKPASFVIDYDFGAVGHVDVKNATHKVIKTVLTPVLDKDKKISNVIVQAIDITEIKQSEEEKIRVNKILAEHEKLSLVGQVAGKMAHDFNNVLGIIMGNSELALVDCPDDQTKKRLELIYNQTIRGKNLTKNLVAFARDQEPKQEFFSIDEKMDLVLTLLKKDLEGINVIRQYGHGMPELLADSGMIEHAIVNLVQNSIHAVSLVEQPEINVHTYHQGELIFIEIEDNGCGIPPEFIEAIYEPSFTLKGSKDITGMYKPDIKGTGYGMSNVKKYIEQHKGNISIHSNPQKGTKITINLPLTRKKFTEEEVNEVKKEKISFERYLLIVEDEPAISDVQYNILTHEPCHHKVDIANNGMVALDLLNRNQYDLISLDYVLPGKFNGMDIYHHIRETNQIIPILFISGNIEFLESIKDLKKNDPYIDHLSKPCKNIDYLNGINQLFGKVTI